MARITYDEQTAAAFKAVREEPPRATPRARRVGVRVLEGNAGWVPLPDASADAVWLSLVIHHIPDLEVAAQEIRRVLLSGAPVLIRQGFPDRYEPLGDRKPDAIELVRWFPETARVIATYPSVKETCTAFATAGFHQDALEQVRETYLISLRDFLGQVDTFRHADTTMRSLSEEEFLSGKERLRRAI